MVTTVTVLDSGGATQTVNTLPALGKVTGANSLPVTLASDDMVKAGVRGTTANPTPVSDGTEVAAVGDKLGRTVIVPHQVRDLMTRSAVITLTTTAETTLIAAVAATFLDMLSIKLCNTSTTGVRVDVRDTTAGTVQDTWYIPGNATIGIVFPAPFKQSTVNTNWTVQLAGAVTDVRIVAQFAQNI